MTERAWPTLYKVLAALGLHPFFVFDRDKARALAELREALEEIEKLRERVARLEGLPTSEQVARLVGGSQP